MQAKQKKHPFTYTLGNGPFEYAGYFDLGSRVNAMNNGRDYAECMRDAPKLKDGLGTCAHCGHAILNIMIVRNGDGELFGVGSDCVRKVYSDGDVKKISQMEKDIKAHKRELRIKRESEKIKELTPAYEAALIELEKRPHMNSY